MNMEKKYKAEVAAENIAKGNSIYGPVVEAHARQMVEDGYGEFKFAKMYGKRAGSYEGATLWVLSDTTRTIRRDGRLVR